MQSASQNNTGQYQGIAASIVSPAPVPPSRSHPPWLRRRGRSAASIG
jgi:hypothetical protein